MATTRAKRPEVKIPVKDFNDLTTYCKGTDGNTPTRIVTGLVSDFLIRDDVQAVIAAQSQDKKLLKDIAKRKAALAKIQAEVVELEAKLKSE